MVQPTVELYDSGSVAAGAEITSPYLNLYGLEAISVIIDNTAGSVYRDLVLESYLVDGTTLVDSIVVRRCGYGAAATGGVYPGGRVRGTIGPNAVSSRHGVYLLYTETGADNAALDTGNLNTEEAESVFWKLNVTGGGSCTVGTRLVADDGTYYTAATTGAAVNQTGGAGLGIHGGGLTANGILGIGPPRRTRFVTSAPGVGSTTTLHVYTRGAVPGTFAHQTLLPLVARLRLLSNGAAAARMTIFGR